MAGKIVEQIQNLCQRRGGRVDFYRRILPKENKVEVIAYHEVYRPVYSALGVLTQSHLTKRVSLFQGEYPQSIPQVEQIENQVRNLIAEFRTEPEWVQINRNRWWGVEPLVQTTPV